MLTDLVIAIVCTIIMSILGLVIVLRNPKNTTNLQFGFLSFSISAWSVFNYFSGGSSTNRLVLQLVFFFGVLTAYSLIVFMLNFPISISASRFISRVLTYATAIMLVVVFLPGFIKNITKDNIETGSLYIVFIVYALIALGLLAFLASVQIRASKTKTSKQQAKLIALGVMLYAVFALLSNVIIPLFVDNWTSSRFGPVFSLLLVAMVAYSIVKHRLFDIRLIVARFLAYVLLLASLTTTYAIIVYAFTQKITFRGDLSFIKNAIPFVAAILIALSFQTVKKFFDRVSNKYFYQDAYDPQLFLDELNKILVSTIEIKTLLEKVADQINLNLKSQFAIFSIKSTPHTDSRSAGSPGTLRVDSDGVHEVITAMSSLRQKIIVADDIEDEANLKKLLTKHNIAMLLRLTSSGKDSKESVGYLLLGAKKSGSPYSNNDTKIMGIITNELVIAIQNALRFEEIQQFNLTLQQKVDDATHKLRQTNEKLRQLDETKDEFISMASHQLRTPLTSVKGYVSMVLEGDAGKVSKSQKDLLNQAFTSSQRMVYLIADLLNVSRLRTGKFVIDAKPTNLADVVQGEIGQLIETAKGRNLELTYHKPDHFPVLNLDDTKTRQVIMNFIDNAIYYTPAKGHIKVNLAESDDAVEFTVVDNGLGVPKAEQHHLFTKFYRAGNAKKARPDGTGLGLFMARKVIVAEGGAVIFKSEEGKGSTFGFSFPKSKLLVHDSPAKNSPAVATK
ncbi:MAG: Sensor protein resE [Candidatus Saccharibacteria bacterium]|nr:Sensor protein resE [Candidatus Saccharibacteria bacterium]